MKRTVALFLALICLTFAFSACSAETVRVAALKGPTAMGMVQMMQAYPEDYLFSVNGSVDEISPLLLKGEVDIAALPANLGANLYQKTNGEVIALCVNTLGVLYLVENGESVHSISDLKGRTVFLSGRGATPEYALRHILTGNGIDPDQDVVLDFKSEHTECLSSLLLTPGSVALLPQPFVTVAQMQQEGIRMALDLNREWAALGKGELLTGVLVVRRQFLEQEPEKLRSFMTRYADSVRFANDSPKQTAAFIEQYGILKADVAEKAIPYCGIVCMEGEEMMRMLSGYLSVLYEQNPASVGGQLPEEDFYYGVGE